MLLMYIYFEKTRSATTGTRLSFRVATPVHPRCRYPFVPCAQFMLSDQIVTQSDFSDAADMYQEIDFKKLKLSCLISAAGASERVCGTGPDTPIGVVCQ